MSKQDKPHWVVTVDIDYTAKEYRGANIMPLPGPVIYAHKPYIQVQADDEIGAFNEAQYVMQRLGFRFGA